MHRGPNNKSMLNRRMQLGGCETRACTSADRVQRENPAECQLPRRHWIHYVTLYRRAGTGGRVAFGRKNRQVSWILHQRTARRGIAGKIS